MDNFKKEKQLQYVFRIPARRQDQWAKVQDLLNELHEFCQKTKEKGEYAIKKSDLIVESLEIGVTKLKKIIEKEKNK